MFEHGLVKNIFFCEIQKSFKLFVVEEAVPSQNGEVPKANCIEVLQDCARVSLVVQVNAQDLDGNLLPEDRLQNLKKKNYLSKGYRLVTVFSSEETLLHYFIVDAKSNIFIVLNPFKSSIHVTPLNCIAT